MKDLSLRQPILQVRPYLPLIGVAIIYFLVINLFEAGQQLYYIKRFTSPENQVTYFELLKAHSRRWFIWILLTIPFVNFVLKNRITQSIFTTFILTKYLGGIFAWLFITIICVCLVEMWGDGAGLNEFVEYFQFFIAQKFALFFSGFIGVVILVHLYIKQRELEGKRYEFLSLKEQYNRATEALNQKEKNITKDLISIKIGNKVKLIPLSEITWIQSADYCVQIHTKNERAYFVRQSMKAMDNQLNGKGFIRIHRGTIVNLVAVSSIQLNPTAAIKLFSGEILPIANRRLSKVKALIKEIGN